MTHDLDKQVRPLVALCRQRKQVAGDSFEDHNSDDDQRRTGMEGERRMLTVEGSHGTAASGSRDEVCTTRSISSRSPAASSGALCGPRTSPTVEPDTYLIPGLGSISRS